MEDCRWSFFWCFPGRYQAFVTFFVYTWHIAKYLYYSYLHHAHMHVHNQNQAQLPYDVQLPAAAAGIFFYGRGPGARISGCGVCGASCII